MCCVFSRHQDLLRWSTRTHCGGSWPPSPGPLIVSRPIQEYAKVQEIHWNLINGSLRFDIGPLTHDLSNGSIQGGGQGHMTMAPVGVACPPAFLLRLCCFTCRRITYVGHPMLHETCFANMHCSHIIHRNM